MATPSRSAMSNRSSTPKSFLMLSSPMMSTYTTTTQTSLVRESQLFPEADVVLAERAVEQDLGLHPPDSTALGRVDLALHLAGEGVGDEPVVLLVGEDRRQFRGDQTRLLLQLTGRGLLGRLARVDLATGQAERSRVVLARHCQDVAIVRQDEATGCTFHVLLLVLFIVLLVVEDVAAGVGPDARVARPSSRRVQVAADTVLAELLVAEAAQDLLNVLTEQLGGHGGLQVWDTKSCWCRRAVVRSEEHTSELQ